MADKGDARWKEWPTVFGMFSHYTETAAKNLIAQHKIPTKLAWPHGRFDHRGRELAATTLYDMEAVKVLHKVDGLNRWRRDEAMLEEARKARLQTALMEAILG